MKSFSRGLVFTVTTCALLCGGCASYKPFPPGYLKSDHQATVVVKRMPEHPQMLDSGRGGIIGALITGSSRTERMREQLTGIHGDSVQRALLEELNRKMGEHLILKESPGDLRIEVSVLIWGWYVPTIDFGIKVGQYESQIVGRVEVFDAAQNKRIAFAKIQIERPIGLKPQEESARAAVSEVAQAFAAEAEQALVHSVKPTPSRHY